MQAISCEACIRAGEDCKVNYNYKAVCLRCADKKVHCTIGPQPAKPGKNFRSDKKGIREKAKLWHDTVLAAIKFNATNPPESKISYPLYPVIEEDEDQQPSAKATKKKTASAPVVRSARITAAQRRKAGEILEACLRAGEMDFDDEDLQTLAAAGMGEGSMAYMQAAEKIAEAKSSGAKTVEPKRAGGRSKKVAQVCYPQLYVVHFI